MAQTAAPGAPTAPASGPAKGQVAAAAAAPTSVLNAPLFYELLIGEITAREGEPSAGFALILDAARKTNDAELYQRATDIALESRSGEAALQSARAWKQALPNSREANRYVLRILIALNRIADTEAPLNTEVKMAPGLERAVVIASIPRGYATASDKALAAKVVTAALTEFLTPATTRAPAWATIGQMRLAAGDEAGALEAAKQGLADDAAAKAPLLLALDLMDPKQPQAEALVKKSFENRTANAPAQPEIRLLYAQVLLGQLRYSEAMVQLQAITQQTPDYPQSWLILGSLQLQGNELALARTSLERYVALVTQTPEKAAETLNARGLDQAYLSLAQLAEKQKNYAGAESWLDKIDNPAVLAQVQIRRASVLARQGKTEEGRALIRALPEASPDDSRRKINAEVSLLREFKQYPQAHSVLAAELAKAPDDTDLLYDQAMLAEKLDSLGEMETLLRRVIALKPDYHQAYNALGYSLADRGLRLTEARELIQKALSFAPADPFIEDSLAWVEFRLGNKAEAVRIFESAYKTRPDPEIAAHFGEVLWSMGQRDRAVALWKEAMAHSADNETLTETLKRLQVKL